VSLGWIVPVYNAFLKPKKKKFAWWLYGTPTDKDVADAALDELEQAILKADRFGAGGPLHQPLANLRALLEDPATKNWKPIEEEAKRLMPQAAQLYEEGKAREQAAAQARHAAEPYADPEAGLDPFQLHKRRLQQALEASRRRWQPSAALPVQTIAAPTPVQAPTASAVTTPSPAPQPTFFAPTEDSMDYGMFGMGSVDPALLMGPTAYPPNPDRYVTLAPDAVPPDIQEDVPYAALPADVQPFAPGSYAFNEDVDENVGTKGLGIIPAIAALVGAVAAVGMPIYGAQMAKKAEKKAQKREQQAQAAAIAAAQDENARRRASQQQQLETLIKFGVIGGLGYVLYQQLGNKRRKNPGRRRRRGRR
jgi:hypothetical protein